MPKPTAGGKVGLLAGDKASALGASGISPYYMGSIDFKDAAQIKRVLDYYEPLIVKELVENAIIITRSGDIYHCTGTLNDLDTIVELGDKLRGAIVTHNHPIGSDNDYSFSLKDRYLFENYKLARLRGIDEKFIYELNRNSAFLDSEDDVVAGDEETFTNSHLRNIQLARFLGFGYRRWRHE
ncbi:MAG: hypothetical protein SR1Q7_00040 [Quinella sp. 1Q7]|nr:hypothetical protein [Quinella sp. 1Q7]